MTDAKFDIRQDQYATALRELLRHENDLTNHRIMWLLVGQGFIANAFVSNSVSAPMKFGLHFVGILLTLSAFVMLYKSYQARGYIEYLGNKAKEGTLSEEYLPLMGWPRTGTGAVIPLAIALTFAMLSVYCVVVVHYQVKQEESTEELKKRQLL
jgi:hypothetical protein